VFVLKKKKKRGQTNRLPTFKSKKETNEQTNTQVDKQSETPML